MSQDVPNEQLVAVLSSASSHVQNERDAAVSFLEQHQQQQGFQYELVKVVAVKSLPVNVRTQAILFFKNGLDKYWRKGTPNAVDPANKQLIRSKLLTLVDEDDRTIAKTLALCVAKIARTDYEPEWPDLFDNLSGTMSHVLQNSSGMPNPRLVLHRCLLIFQQCTKLLSQNRTTRGKMILGRLCEQSLPVLIQLYRHFFSAALAALTASPILTDSPAQPEDLELSLLTLKIISKLVVYGWGGAIALSEEERPIKEQFTETQKQFFHSTIPDFVQLHTIRKDKALTGQLAEGSRLNILNKHVRQYIKFYKALLVQNHIIFHSLGATVELVTLLWGFVSHAATDLPQLVSEEAIAPYPERFLVDSLLLVKSCFTQFPTAWKDYRDPELAAQMTDTIVSRLLPLRPADLEKWQAEPEEWIQSEEGEKWQYDLRPCSEALLKELVKEYTDIVGPRLAHYMQEARAASTYEQILLKEAIYTAFGRSPEELNKFIAFGDWLNTSLMPDAFSTDPSQLIVRRRVAWIVGNWVGEDVSLDTHTKIYQTICHLLQNNASTDLATRLTAAKAMGQCDTWEFDKTSFLPFLEVTMRELASLLEEVDLPETQMKINNVLGIVISRVGRDIAPHVAQLMTILPRLWANAETEDLFKTSIIVTFKKLVEALETESQVLHGACGELIRHSCDPASPPHVFLQEDGLDLWKSLLRFSQGPSDHLSALAPLALAMLPNSTDILPRLLRLVESYALLDSASFVPTYADAIFGSLSGLLRNLDAKATKPILYTSDMLIASSSVAVWAPALDASGMIATMLDVIISDASAVVITRHLCTLARIAISDTNTFHQLLQRALLQEPLAEKQISYDEMLKKLLAQFLDRYDNLSYPGQRKLVALGLTYLVRTTNPIILDRFDEIVTVWLSALGETEENESGECVSSFPDGSGPSGQASPHPYQPSPSPFESGSSRSGSLSPIFDNDSHTLYQGGFPQCSQDSQYSTYSASTDYGMQEYRRGSVALTTPSPSPTDTMDDRTVTKSNDSHMEGNGNGSQSGCWAEEDGGGAASDWWNKDATVWEGDATVVDEVLADWPTSTSVQTTPNPNCSAGRNSADVYYNTDEAEEEFELGWGDGWGADPSQARIPENERLNALVKQDPIHTHKLITVVSAAVQETQHLNGGPELFKQNVLAGIEPIVLQELTERLQGLARAGD